MARPRDLQDGKKTERFVINVTEAEAMSIYREAARRDIPPAALLRRFVRLAMSATVPEDEYLGTTESGAL